MEGHGGLHVVHGLPDDGSDVLGDLGIKQAAVHLENDGGAGLLGCLHNAHNGFQIVHIERGYGEAVLLTNVQNLLQIVNHNASSCYVIKFQFFRIPKMQIESLLQSQHHYTTAAIILQADTGIIVTKFQCLFWILCHTETPPLFSSGVFTLSRGRQRSDRVRTCRIPGWNPSGCPRSRTCDGCRGLR